MVELMKDVFPKPKEELDDFLNKCKLSNSKTMLCPNCNVVYDEITATKIELIKNEESKGNLLLGKGPRIVIDKIVVPYRLRMPQGKAKFP